MLTGKNIIVTGARRGIGRSVVEICSKYGANIWACARKDDNVFRQDMQELEKLNGNNIWPIYFDVSDEEQIRQAIYEIRKTKQTVDVLINIAGIVDESSSFTMSSIEKMKHVFDVNFWGATVLTQYVARLMIRNKCGNIINVSSIASLDGEPAQYEYASSKAALNGATKQLARELWQYGVRVNAVAPGIVETDMGQHVEADLLQSILHKVIMRRMGKTEEIANVIAFLASDLSSYMTGQVIRVDGGM